MRNGGIVLVGHQSHQAPPRADADSAWEWHHAVVAADPRHVWRAVVAILVMLVIALGMLAGGLWLLWSEWSQSGPVG